MKPTYSKRKIRALGTIVVVKVFSAEFKVTNEQVDKSNSFTLVTLNDLHTVHTYMYIYYRSPTYDRP